MVITTKSSPFVCYVNGKKVVDHEVDPELTLLTYLRLKLRLTGTKLGCGEGGCGACTLMVSRVDRRTNKVVHVAVNACLTPVCAVHGAAVTTVEGIGSVATGLHPAQERLAKSHGSQCGFCTPGIVMSMYTLLRQGVPSMEDVEIAFQGNLCRCTGYRPILEGYKSLTSDGMGKPQDDSHYYPGQDVLSAPPSGGCCGKIKNGCCQQQNGGGGAETPEHIDLFDVSEFKPYDPSQDVIFPPELQLTSEYDDSSIAFIGNRVTWYRPTTLEDLLELKAAYPTAKVVVGNTEIGVEVKFKNMHYPVIIQPTRVNELMDVKEEENGIRFGAAVSLVEINALLQARMKTLPKYKTRIFAAVTEMLRWFAGKQIRSAACLGGNIATGSPISDMNPVLMAANTELILISKEGGRRTVYMDHTFFTGYRRNVLKPDEIIESILIPYTSENEYFWGFKQAKRRDDDIAIVTAAILVKFQDDTNIVENISLSFGGMAPMTVLARKTAAALIGKRWNEDIVEAACKYLIEDLPLGPGAPGGMIRFRSSLTLSFFFKFYLIVANELNKNRARENGDMEGLIEVRDDQKSVTKLYHRAIPQSTQLYQIVPEDQPDFDLVGKPVIHMSALKQATGEAIYIDDMPKFENELYLALVLSSKAHAKIVSIDTTEAMKIEGVVDFFSAKDVPDDRRYVGPVIHDEEVFASETVTCVGHIIGAIVGINQAIAQRAAKLVKIQYEEIKPIIVTFEDAIANNSYYEGFTREIKNGDMAKGFAEADHILEGTMYLGGQEHFYLETQATIAYPKNEDGEMELFCSTQNPSEVQLLAAHILGVKQNKIAVRAKRMGGGFGGKESSAMRVAGPVAVAAQKLGVPIRCMLDRDEDMALTGTRHPFYNKYKVGFKKNGQITAMESRIFNNAGNTLDLSCSILERSVFHSDNSYNIPNVDVFGRCCKTNIPSNTAFRGFGGPQGMFFMENIIDTVAEFLQMDPLEVREMHMYKEGDETHYGQKLGYCTINRCWEEVKKSSNYERKCAEVEEYNRNHRYKKRGVSMIPVKFGIAFTALFLNQAGALVLIYRDGSVLISHGGTEMGQGLHTKMIQVASRALQVPADRIHISETATDRVPNTSPTAASAGSDLNGMAVLNACKILYERLEPYRAKNPKGTWEQIVNAAYFDRCCLSAAGYYRTPDIGFDFQTRTGDPFNYFTYGAAVSVVEIDCLTGDHETQSTDIVMDVGESLNPAIDIGQIEGGFIQGYGLYTLEELKFTPTGFLITKGPGMYKLPGFGDIPLQFNVALLRGAPNPRAVFSSKAIGEPPLFLASSVFFAIKNAIRAYRLENGIPGLFHLNSPATAERIRMGCDDKFTKNFPIPEPGSFTPWAVDA